MALLQNETKTPAETSMETKSACMIEALRDVDYLLEHYRSKLDSKTLGSLITHDSSFKNDIVGSLFGVSYSRCLDREEPRR